MTTISRALVTIKHLKPQVLSDMQQTTFTGVFKNGVEINTGIATKKFVEDSRKSLQSIRDKLNSEFDLRQRINKANMNTVIDIVGKKMSITDALTYRTHILPQIKSLYQVLVQNLNASRNVYKKSMDAYENKISNADAEYATMIEKLEKPTISDVQSTIDSLKKEIDFFELEFDAILTETNPTITI